MSEYACKVRMAECAVAAHSRPDETKRDFAKRLRQNRGWRIHRDGTAVCPHCAKVLGK